MTAITLANSLGYLTENEVGAIKRAASMIQRKDPIVVNIGAGAGTSSLAIAEARPDAILFSVDISPSGPLGGLKGELHAFNQNHMKPPHQILGDSREVGKNWKNYYCCDEIDMIFIDDGHQYDEILGDIISWRPNMSKGGIMVFHDYGSNNWPAVAKAIDENFTDEDKIFLVDSTIAFYV